MSGADSVGRDGASGRKSLAVLVPSFNSTATIESTLRAILDRAEELQRHVDFVMLSDDGSRDDTVALAERVWGDGPVPLVVRRAERNVGEYRNVNGAFAAMPGHIEWVLIMHADNEPLPGWVDLLARECARADDKVASICGSWHVVMDGRVKHLGDPRGPDHVERIAAGTESVRSTLLRGCWWHNSTAAVRVAAWRAVGGHPQQTPLEGTLQVLGVRPVPEPPPRMLRIKGDWDTLLRFLESGWDVLYVAHPLIRYIEVTTSVSAGSFAWHGDLIETLQVARRHDGALRLRDVWWLHGDTLRNLSRRFGGALLRRDFVRAGHAVRALPVVFASLLVMSARRMSGRTRALERIPFMAKRSPL